jgi:hypothetical protein
MAHLAAFQQALLQRALCQCHRDLHFARDHAHARHYRQQGLSDLRHFTGASEPLSQQRVAEAAITRIPTLWKHVFCRGCRTHALNCESAVLHSGSKPERKSGCAHYRVCRPRSLAPLLLKVLLELKKTRLCRCTSATLPRNPLLK